MRAILTVVRIACYFTYDYSPILLLLQYLQVHITLLKLCEHVLQNATLGGTTCAILHAQSIPEPNLIELLDQTILLNNFLLSRYEQNTSQKWYM